MYRVFITSHAGREFKKLSAKLKQELYNEFKKLETDPFSHPQTKRLERTRRGWRLRLGRWRILFALFRKEKRIEIVDIFFKKGKEDYIKRRKLMH